MTSMFPPRLIEFDGTINIEVLKNEIGEAAAERKLGKIQALSATLAKHKPDTFDGAYAVFEPMLALLDTYDTYTRDPKLDIIIGEWADALEMSKPEHLNKMLAMKQSETRVVWLTNLGADPNAVLDSKSPENLTIIGQVCRVMWDEQYDEDGVRELARVLLTRGDIPYSIKPRYDGDPDACDLFEAVMLKDDGSSKAASAVFEAVEECYGDGTLTLEAQHQIGQVCSRPGGLATYEALHHYGNSAFLPLAFARFEDPTQWVKAFGNLGKHARMDILFYQSRENLCKQLLESVTRDAAPVDEVTVHITDERIPCTLLQAAAWCGDERAVKRLIDAGADPSRTVGAESAKHKIADMDAATLWEYNPDNKPCELLDTLKARRAVDQVLRTAGAKAANGAGPC